MILEARVQCPGKFCRGRAQLRRPCNGVRTQRAGLFDRLHQDTRFGTPCETPGSDRSVDARQVVRHARSHRGVDRGFSDLAPHSLATRTTASTPRLVGPGTNTFLGPGDNVRVEIEGIGAVENRIVREVVQRPRAERTLRLHGERESLGTWEWWLPTRWSRYSPRCRANRRG